MKKVWLSLSLSLNRHRVRYILAERLAENGFSDTIKKSGYFEKKKTMYQNKKEVSQKKVGS